MLRAQVAPKLVGETRIEQIDLSALVGFGGQVTGVVATCAVYSGVDLNPSAILGNVYYDGTYNRALVTLTGGVLGCVYQVTLTVSVSLPAPASYTGGVTLPTTATVGFFLAITPDFI